MTSLILSRQRRFVSTETFCRDKSFVATKMILVAAPANDTGVLCQREVTVHTSHPLPVQRRKKRSGRLRWTFRFLFFVFLWTFFNASSLQTYIHGAPEDMRHWYSQHFISHKHGMNEQEKEVDESIICLPKKKKKVCKAPTWKRHLNMSSSS